MPEAAQETKEGQEFNKEVKAFERGAAHGVLAIAFLRGKSMRGDQRKDVFTQVVPRMQAQQCRDSRACTLTAGRSCLHTDSGWVMLLLGFIRQVEVHTAGGSSCDTLAAMH